MNRRIKKLSLHKETLRALDADDLGRVGGAAGKKKDTVWDSGCGMNTTMCESSPLACLTKKGTLCQPLPPITKA